MKSKEELKKELHELIDSIENKETLEDTEEEELTPAQKQRLNEAIQQADEGKVMSLEEFYSRMAKWHTN